MYANHSESKKMQNKGFNESHNGSARVINLCTFPSQPTQRSEHTKGALFLYKAFFTNSALASSYRHATDWKDSKVLPFPNTGVVILA